MGNIEEIVSLAKSLMKIKSVSGNIRESKRVADYAEKYLGSKKGVCITRFVKNGKHSLVATFERTKKPVMFLNGHLDVVDAEKKDFISEVRKGRLWGRGAADMKGPAAIMMAAFTDFAKSKKRPSLGLILTTDEEEGGENGTQYLLKEAGYSCEVAVIPDGGENIAGIVNKTKGVLHLRITARGKSAHGSMPWLGNNAIEKLMEGYAKLRGTFPKVDRKHLWKPTLNLGAIKGGHAANNVPDCAQMLIDIRVTEKEDAGKIFNVVERIFDDCEVELLTRGAVFYLPEQNVHLKKYVKIAQKVIGKKMSFICEHGASDARYFADKNIAVIINQPYCGNIHASGEWIDIESMEIFYNVLVGYIKEIGFKKA